MASQEKKSSLTFSYPNPCIELSAKKNRNGNSEESRELQQLQIDRAKFKKSLAKLHVAWLWQMRVTTRRFASH
jgi:hypothetical protein